MLRSFKGQVARRVLDVIDSNQRKESLVPPRSVNFNSNAFLGYTGVIEANRTANINALRVAREHLNGDLRDAVRVLDFGCCTSPIAQAFSVYPVKDLNLVEYYGLDIDEKVIGWCRETFAGANNFHFEHLRYDRPHYALADNAILDDVQASSTISTSFTNLNLPTNFNIQLSGSVFTHLLFEEIVDYIRELAARVVPGGILINSMFVLDEKNLEKTVQRRRETDTFPFPDRRFFPLDDMTYIVNRENVRSANGFRVEQVQSIYREAGLEIVDIMYGSWSQTLRSNPINYQDWVVARKK